MSTINRLLSRKDKHHGNHKEKVPASPARVPSTSTSASLSTKSTRASSSSSSLYAVSLAFAALLPKRSPRLQATIEPIQCSSANPATLLLQPKQHGGPLHGHSVPEQNEPDEQPEKEGNGKIKALLKRLSKAGITTFKESDVANVLAGSYSQGDVEKAYELLLLLEDSEEGIIQSFNPNIQLLGAVNRDGVTCYLDALLFAMFARLGSFEAMLYKSFEDGPRKRLATLLRLWVNTLRSGKLITTDITKQIQHQLSCCGWKEAEELRQQDASEAFTFITSTLALPLLTLKMDIFHTGKEDVSDDHKFVNERLLELAVPDEPLDGHVITLEKCLEMFFNNKIEVKRYLDQLERRNTISSIRSRPSTDSTKAQASHVEVAEIGDLSQPSSPIAIHTQSSPIPVSPVRPSIPRKRAPSIIQEHYIDEKKGLHDFPSSSEEKRSLAGRVRKEVMMPAWQFYSLIPWYTNDIPNNIPSNDAQVAQHFSSTRPILGICLKRYSVLSNGTAVKRKTRIDIPLEIGLPHFIQDDDMTENGPAFGNFKLSLQSVVCHQGLSTESGHYISLVRSPDPYRLGEDSWMRFDDLATERVIYTNVETFLLQESPYLLFYQVIPIESDQSDSSTVERPIMEGELPPAYSESNASRDSKVDSGVSVLSASPKASQGAKEAPTNAISRPSVEIERPSSERSLSEDSKRGRSSLNSERPHSIVFSDANGHGAGGVKKDLLNPSSLDTIQPDGPNTLTASRRGSKTGQVISKSRPSSRSDEKRMSTSLSRLASRMSKDKLNKTSAPPNAKDNFNAPIPQPGQKTELPVHMPEPATTVVNEKPSNWGKLRKDINERSKAARSDPQLLVKGRRKDGKPDRECSVM